MLPKTISKIVRNYNVCPKRGIGMYKVGVDVGGTFTDVLLVDTENSKFFTSKVPSTPEDSSIGVLAGILKACQAADVSISDIEAVTHGTTVATNAVLTERGAKVGLITTKGYRQVLQIARSYVPGGLGGWLYYQKKAPLAPLNCTIEIEERIYPFSYFLPCELFTGGHAG